MVNKVRLKIYYLFEGEFFRDAAVIFFANVIAGIFSLLYQLVSARLMTVSQYGTFNTLIAFLTIGSMATLPLNMTFTRYFTEYAAEKDGSMLTAIFSIIMKRLSIICLIFFLLFGMLSSLFAAFLKTYAIYVLICVLSVTVILFSSPLISFLQSLQKFGLYSYVNVSSSLLKLLIGYILLYIGWGVAGSLLGFMLAGIFTTLLAAWFVLALFKKEMPRARKEIDAAALDPLYRYFFPVFLAVASFAVLTNADVILVKHFFPSDYAGDYSIAQSGGKIIFFLLFSIAIVVFPKSTASFINGVPSLKILYRALFFGGILCLMIEGLYFIYPYHILSLLTGKAGAMSSSLFGWLGLAASFYALSWTIINYLIAVHMLRFIAPVLAVTFLEIITIYAWHPTAQAVVSTVLIFSIISFSALLLIAERSCRYG